ncbi:MAG: hypothetical protein E7172_04595 [Firmicutes bacterium]|nr:hypothetical protein [Bacillota bacterium]
MDLNELKGNIIGVVMNYQDKDNWQDKKINQIITTKLEDSLKMVNLNNLDTNIKYQNLSLKEQNQIKLASQLNNETIILNNFFQTFPLKEKINFKKLLKKISQYNKKIIIVSNNSEDFLNFVDKVYVINKEKIIFETNNLYDLGLYKYIKMPQIVEFVDLVRSKNVKIDDYFEIDELLKAVFRLKS